MANETQLVANTSKIAEAALRNLRLEGLGGGDQDNPFKSRMLRMVSDRLVIEQPVGESGLIELAPGESVVCICQLGQEVLRFSAEVKGPTTYKLDQSRQMPAILLCRLGDPDVVRRRQYDRFTLDHADPMDVAFWVMELGPSGAARVCEEFHGTAADISAGGVSVTIEQIMWLRFLGEKQLWVRFMLPDQNESLIYHAEVRHCIKDERTGQHRLGLQFTEAIEPGQEQKMLAHLASFEAAKASGLVG